MKRRPSGDAPAKNGRPTSLTPAMHDAIVADVEAGVKFEDAAAKNDINATSLYLWLKKGDKGEEPYARFSKAIRRARAFAKATAIANVRAGMLPSKEPTADWKAEAWFLERTFPNEYGPQQAVAVKVQKELDLALDKIRDKLGPDVYDKVLNAIAAEDSSEEAGGD